MKFNRNSVSAILLSVMLSVVISTSTVYAEPDDNDEPESSYSTEEQDSQENSEEASVMEEPEEPSYESSYYTDDDEISYNESSDESSYDNDSYTEESSYSDYYSNEESSEYEYYEEPSYESEDPYYAESSYYEEYSYTESYYYDGESNIYYEETSFFTDTEPEETSFESMDEPSLQSLSSSEIESSIESSVLTSEDWKKFQESVTPKTSQTTKTSTVTPKETAIDDNNAGDFDTIKNSKDEKNDAWIYLIAGIALILVGAGIITAIIIYNIKAKKRELSHDEEKSTNENDPHDNKEKTNNEVPVENNEEYADLNEFADNTPSPSAEAFKAIRAAKKIDMSSTKKDKTKDFADTLDTPLDLNKKKQNVNK